MCACVYLHIGGEEIDSDDMMYGTTEHKGSIYDPGQDPGFLPFSTGNINNVSTHSNASSSGDGGDDGAASISGKGSKTKKTKKAPMPVRV